MAEWPATDRDAWDGILHPAGFLERPGPAAAWAPDTRRGVAKSYGRFLGWLAETGQLDRDAGPLERFDPALVNSFVAHLRTMNVDRTVITRLIHLDMLARALAPTMDWSFLRRWQRRLEPEVRDISHKLRRLRRADECVDLGFELMRRCRFIGTEPASYRQSALYRDGLMLAALTLRPLRLGNFTGLALDHHLLQRDGIWVVHIPRAETKTRRRPIDEPWPECLVEPLEVYLRQVRPAMMARSPSTIHIRHDRLWVGIDGDPLPERGVHRQIALRTRAAFGQPMNPHLFRDAAPTTIALAAPEHIRDAAALLGHADFRTTEAYYRLSQSVVACRVHQEILAQLAGGKREGSR